MTCVFLAQVQLREPLRKSIKNKREVIRTIVNSVRETCADWLRGMEPQDDPVLKGKKDPDEGFHIKVPRRNVGPSSTQVQAREISAISHNSSHFCANLKSYSDRSLSQLSTEL